MGNTRYKASENYILREVGGAGVLISVGANIADYNGYIELTETAAFIWKLLKDGASADELVAALKAEYEVSDEDAAADVREFLDELIEHKMVSADE